MEYIIAFKNTNFSIKAERCLLEQKLRVAVMTLPSQIRAGCGICLRIPPEDIKLALGALSNEGIDGMEMYSRIAKDNKFVYAEVKDGSY